MRAVVPDAPRHWPFSARYHNAVAVPILLHRAFERIPAATSMDVSAWDDVA